MASYYNRGECLTLLGNAGIDIFCCHKVTKSNALHVALERGNYKIASQLILSNFPLNNQNSQHLTPLIIACMKKEANV